MNRREFLRGARAATGLAGWATRRSGSDPIGTNLSNWGQTPVGGGGRFGMRLVDVTAAAGLQFDHNNGAYGGKLLPETLGAGCAFLDYDADGWQDILLVNGMDWPGHKRQRSTLRLYQNNRNGTFSDVTRSAGLDVEMYGMGVAVGDWNNDGFPDLLVTSVGQNRLFRNTGKGTFVDVTRASGLAGRTAFSTSALWFDFDRDGLLDLFVCNYVRWSVEHDVFCSIDGKQKSYCTPEAYRGDTCWLFRNRGDGTFEDVTATSGIFDTSSKSLGAAILDIDGDGWLDLFVANDTQPNKLYRNIRTGRSRKSAVEIGVAFSVEGKARAGMGDRCRIPEQFHYAQSHGHEFRQRDDRPVSSKFARALRRCRDPAGIGAPSRNTLGFGCLFADFDLDGSLDLIVANGHIDETVRNIRGHVGYAQPPHLFLNQGNDTFQRRGSRRRRRICRTESWTRRRVWRLRSRWRSRHPDDNQRRSGETLSQRSTCRQPLASIPPDRHQVQPRRHRRHRSHLSRRHVSDSNGQDRVELSVPIGIARHIRCRPTRSRWSESSLRGRADGSKSSRMSSRHGRTIVSKVVA